MNDWQKGIIVAIEMENPHTKNFIQVSEIEKFDIIPGQLVNLDLPIYEQKNKKCCSYSIVCAPNGRNVFKLNNVYLEGGAGTNYLFNEATIGTEFFIKMPFK